MLRRAPLRTRKVPLRRHSEWSGGGSRTSTPSHAAPSWGQGRRLSLQVAVRCSKRTQSGARHPSRCHRSDACFSRTSNRSNGRAAVEDLRAGRGAASLAGCVRGRHLLERLTDAGGRKNRRPEPRCFGTRSGRGSSWPSRGERQQSAPDCGTRTATGTRGTVRPGDLVASKSARRHRRRRLSDR